MGDDYPRTTDYFRYRSISMIVRTLFVILFFGGLLLALGSIAQGNSESGVFQTLLLIAVITGFGLDIFSAVVKIETSSDGLGIERLLLKPKHIPWYDIREVRLEQNRGQWCVIEYGEDPVKKESFIVDHDSQHARDKRDRLLTVIVNQSQLQRVGKNHWGRPTLTDSAD